MLPSHESPVCQTRVRKEGELPDWDWTYILEEDLQDAASLFVDKTRDTLDTTTTSKTTNGLMKWSVRADRVTVKSGLRTGLVIPWMLSRRILRWRLAPPFPRPLPPLPPREDRVSHNCSPHMRRWHRKARAGTVITSIADTKVEKGKISQGQGLTRLK